MDKQFGFVHVPDVSGIDEPAKKARQCLLGKTWAKGALSLPRYVSPVRKIKISEKILGKWTKTHVSQISRQVILHTCIN